jgi:hypothetical protein
MSLIGANYYYYNRNAFYMRNGELVEVRINSRIIVNTV